MKIFNALILLLVMIFLFWFSRSYFAVKKVELEQKEAQFTFEKYKYQKDLIKFCQETAANTQNKGWKYENCVTQLIKVVPTFND